MAASCIANVMEMYCRELERSAYRGKLLPPGGAAARSAYPGAGSVWLLLVCQASSLIKLTQCTGPPSADG